MTSSGFVVGLAALALTLTVPSRAAAQARAQTHANIGAGYSYLRETGANSVTYATGWMMSAATKPNASISWVGEVAGNYRNVAAFTQKLASYQGGARFILRPGQVTPFVQGLVGVEHYSEPGFAETGLAVQPGGGVDVALTDRLGLRAQLDFRVVRVGATSESPAETFKEWRLGIGAAIAIGR
jgi:hypothetical protein